MVFLWFFPGIFSLKALRCSLPKPRLLGRQSQLEPEGIRFLRVLGDSCTSTMEHWGICVSVYIYIQYNIYLYIYIYIHMIMIIPRCSIYIYIYIQYIYLQNWVMCGVNVSNYDSTMEHMGYVYNYIYIGISYTYKFTNPPEMANT